MKNPLVGPMDLGDRAPLLGVLARAEHYFLTKAYERGPAAVISPFNYRQLLGATLLGYLIFGQLPDAWTWIGAAILVGCGLYIAQREAVRQPSLRRLRGTHDASVALSPW